MDRNSRLAVLLIAPLLLLMVVGFVLPLGTTAFKAFGNPEVTAALPRTTVALDRWDGEGPPAEAVYAAFVEDLLTPQDNRVFGALIRRLNFEHAGMRSLLSGARRAAPDLQAPYSQSLPALNPAWGDADIWRLIRTHSNAYTATYVLRAMDLRTENIGETGAKRRPKVVVEYGPAAKTSPQSWGCCSLNSSTISTPSSTDRTSRTSMGAR